MDSFARGAQLGACDQQEADNMDFFLFVAACVSVIAVCLCINAAAQELRGIRGVLETHANLSDPLKVRTYQRREGSTEL